MTTYHLPMYNLRHVLVIEAMFDSEMRHFQACQQQINDAEQSFSQDQATSKHNDRRLALALPSPPPETDEAADCSRQSE